MKIGILTQPLHKNYGGLLQNYALQQVLKGMGHEPETIDNGVKRVSFFHRFLSTIKAYLLPFFLASRYKKPRYSPNTKEIAIIRQNTDYFIKKYISRTKVLHTSKGFENIANTNNYNAYVVGSDQCWRPKYNDSFLLEMFLSFAEHQPKVKRIAYAASFGTDEWEYSPEMTIKCSALAKKFDLITVREASGVELCRKHLGVDALHVLDPTMLLEKEDYIKLVENENEPQSKGNLFYYILDPNYEKKTLIKDISVENGLTPFTVMPKYQEENRTKEDVKERIEDCVYPSVTSWLRAFMDAKMVIVDSFHGAVFSIIFNKPFWVIANTKRGCARFDSLLELFGLEERMITPDDLIDWNKEIDWERVNEIRNKQKILSLKNFEILSK
jgi:hypothetical protein